ncbi:MAG TPA: universal stress protein [Rhodothermales bacterium]|nr:universal stress protein [Rhodothermales bacterium]
MPDIKRILVPTDFKWGAVQALRHAVALADEFDAELHVLHVAVGPLDEDRGVLSFTDMEELRNRMQEGIRQQPTAVGLERESARPIRYAARRHTDSAQGILDYAADYDIELIVMGTRGRPVKGTHGTGSTAVKVVRRASCSVLTVGANGLFIPGLVKRILVPVNFSDHAALALTLARILARRTQAHLSVLHVLEPAVQIGLLPGSFDVKAKRSVGEAYADLEQFYGRTRGPGVPHRYHVVQGRAAEQIVAAAEQHDAHLIVQGGGSADPDSFTPGSVAEDVVGLASCPVLTARGAGQVLTARERQGRGKSWRDVPVRSAVRSGRSGGVLQQDAR